jgi:hypothetical protein
VRISSTWDGESEKSDGPSEVSDGPSETSDFSASLPIAGGLSGHPTSHHPRGIPHEEITHCARVRR